MPTGTVKWFSKEKEFGFITQDGGGDVFVHLTGLNRGVELKDGDSVEYEIEKGPKGLKALNVRLSGSPASLPSTPAQSPKDTGYRGGNGKAGTFPYTFIPRHGRNLLKGKNELRPDQFHDCLLEGNYDIAFDITWKTLTPTAPNPCIDEDPSVRACFPKRENDTDYQGYNRRWLMIDNKLAISPFTVKSAIANGFANLRGGCYRVNTTIEKHRTFEPGQYPYGGQYKRYRVAMDGSSKPGIIKNITVESSGDRTVTIMPVKEFYLDHELPPDLQNVNLGDPVYAIIDRSIKRGHRPAILKKVACDSWDGSIQLKYHGEYHYGMNLSDPNGEKHKHRFYMEEGRIVKGVIKGENFLDEDGMKQIVYLGGRDQDNNEIPLWYEKLPTKAGQFVYCEIFNGIVTNIGNNFLFKAMFMNEDAVPENNKECKSMNDLCPRCRMFGMTEKTSSDETDAVGLKGRFKSAALVNNIRLIADAKDHMFEFLEGDKKVPLKVWRDSNGNRIAGQELLPILGPPKPNKRDIDAYYDKNSGEIKGAKKYKHGTLNLERTIQHFDNEKDYSHRLRNYAQVCEKDLEFTNTIGAENCTIEEIAAFFILLHTPVAGHGFKIGLGKAFGMGSIESSVTKVWIRKKDKYNEWDKIEGLSTLDKNEILNMLEGYLPNVSEEVNKIVKIDSFMHKINSIVDLEKRQLQYPENLRKYWQHFNRNKIKEKK